MAQRRTKKQRAEDTFAQHRKQFRSRAAAEAMGRFYRTNYTRRLANEAVSAGDTAAPAPVDSTAPSSSALGMRIPKLERGVESRFG